MLISQIQTSQSAVRSSCSYDHRLSQCLSVSRWSCLLAQIYMGTAFFDILEAWEKSTQAPTACNSLLGPYFLNRSTQWRERYLIRCMKWFVRHRQVCAVQTAYSGKSVEVVWQWQLGGLRSNKMQELNIDWQWSKSTSAGTNHIPCEVVLARETQTSIEQELMACECFGRCDCVCNAGWYSALGLFHPVSKYLRETKSKQDLLIDIRYASEMTRKTNDQIDHSIKISIRQRIN